MNGVIWKVGRLLNPQSDDQEFEERLKAVQHGLNISSDCEVIAIWLMPEGYLDALVYSGQIFTE